MLHPKIGEFFPKNKQKNKMVVVEKSLLQERIVRLDFNNYPEIYNKLVSINEGRYLPIEHAIITFLSAGIKMFDVSMKE